MHQHCHQTKQIEMNRTTINTLMRGLVAMLFCLIMQCTWAQNAQSRKLEGVVTNEQK
jgi:hypothetical protein